MQTSSTDNSTNLNRPEEAGIEPVSRWKRWQPHLLAFAFYTALTVLFAWPVIAQLGTGTPGHFPVDRNQNLWNFWWFKRSLFNLHNPYQTGFLFYPYGATLYLHTFSPYNLITGLPLQLIFGLVPAYSFIELLTFPLGAIGAYFLALHLTRSYPGALLAGLVWSFGPYHFVELRQDQMNLLSLQWLPFFILFMFRLEKARTRRAIIQEGLAAAFFFFLAIMVDYYYAIYLVMFAGLYWLWRSGTLAWLALRSRESWSMVRRSTGQLTARLAAAFIVGMLPYSPVLLGTLREIGSNKYESLDNLSNDQVHSADLMTVFLPPSHQPWWGDNLGIWKNLGLHAAPTGEYLNNWGAVTGYVGIILAIYALFKLRGLWFWVFNAAFWFLISFGPSLRINGVSTGFPMPYRLLVKLPFVGIGRFPERYMLMAQLSVGILAACGLGYLLAKIPVERNILKLGRARTGVKVRTALAALVLAAFFVESWPGVLPPPDPITQPPFTAAIAANNPNSPVPPDKAIFELPVTTHANPDSPRMLYQIYHDRPITGGYISRKLVDPHRIVHDYVLYDWIELRDPARNDIVPALTPQEQLGLLNYANMGYVVLYPADFTGSGGEQGLNRAQKLIDYTFAQPGAKTAQPSFKDNTASVWQVPPAELTKPELVLGQGWENPENIGGKRVQRWISQEATEAHVEVAVGPKVALKPGYSLELEVVSPGDKPRRLQVLLNGTTVGDVRVQGVQQIKLDNLKLQPGDNTIAFRPDPADGVYIPSQVDSKSTDNRKLRLGFLNIKLS
ncbi:MAG TPA: hypothetical protein VH186_22815 [Chloroflexia bacterium]|nr:hypothetical protein [Chloroflexia bacterium]